MSKPVSTRCSERPRGIVSRHPTFAVASVSRRLFEYPAYVTAVAQRSAPYWDVHPDGTRFILTVRRGASTLEDAVGDETSLPPSQRLQEVYVVTNWFTELRQRIGEQ